ncbi:dual specificity protein phosphatase 8 [Caerostris extrusa]|uniref:Dual specificity protein phosphatase 8 n=1 Tax=Caerostris extrusa TaxID=172846 RepID=A0AAV4PWE9_CAEEX|nr:dual specificity protein phosphatase 8 [Caerostris extrusa]
MSCPVSVVSVHQLASVIRNRMEHVLIIDSRSFIEHNTCHIAASVNVCCSKIVKRRLQQDKLSVTELLIHTCHCDVNEDLEVVVYDQATENVEKLIRG